MADDTVVNFPREATPQEIIEMAGGEEMDYAICLVVKDGQVTLFSNLANRGEAYFLLHAAAQELLDGG